MNNYKSKWYFAKSFPKDSLVELDILLLNGLQGNECVPFFSWKQTHLAVRVEGETEVASICNYAACPSQGKQAWLAEWNPHTHVHAFSGSSDVGG